MVVRESAAEKPETTIHHRAQEIDTSTVTLHRVPTQNLHLHFYKVQLTQQLLPTDHSQWRQFTNLIIEQRQVNADFVEQNHL